VTRFLELGPDGTLSVLTNECVAEEQGEDERADLLISSALRRRRRRIVSS